MVLARRNPALRQVCRSGQERRPVKASDSRGRGRGRSFEFIVNLQPFPLWIEIPLQLLLIFLAVLEAYTSISPEFAQVGCIVRGLLGLINWDRSLCAGQVDRRLEGTGLSSRPSAAPVADLVDHHCCADRLRDRLAGGVRRQGAAAPLLQPRSTTLSRSVGRNLRSPRPVALQRGQLPGAVCPDRGTKRQLQRRCRPD